MDEYKYEPSEFLKANRDFFKGYCFKFEGLSEECEKGFEYIIKDLGGKISKDAKYILVEKTYFQKIENVNRKDIYYLKFILDCIDREVIQDIELYRCIKTSTKSKLNANCNNSIHNRSGEDNVFQELNSVSNEPEKVKRNSKKRKKYFYNYDTEDSSSDETVRIKSEPKSSDSTEDDVHFKNETSNENKNVNVKSEPLSSDDISNCETDDESFIRRNRKMESNEKESDIPQKRINSKFISVRKLVDTKDSEHKKNNSKGKGKKDDSPPSSNPDNSTKVKIKDRHDLKWLFQVDPSNLCREKRCTFAPGHHESHSYAGRIISDEEKKIILQYLIKKNLISRAKGIRTWENMIQNGYLTHRSAETLRNCLRRVILPNICKCNLPVDILDQFLKLEEKKSKGTKIW